MAQRKVVSKKKPVVKSKANKKPAVKPVQAKSKVRKKVISKPKAKTTPRKSAKPSVKKQGAVAKRATRKAVTKSDFLLRINGVVVHE